MYAGGIGVGAQRADFNVDSSKSPLSHFSISNKRGNVIHYLASDLRKNVIKVSKALTYYRD